MKIGINARVLNSARMEGVSRYIYEVTRRMAQQHPEDHFFLFFDRAFDPHFQFGDNVKCIRVGIPARHPLLFRLWMEYSIPKTLRKYDIDVFFSGDTFLSLKSDVPTVIVSHDLAYLHYPDHIPPAPLRYYQKYFPEFHQKAQYIIAVSEATKRDIMKQYQISADLISIGYNAVPNGFTPIDSSQKVKIRERYSDGKSYFIYLGSLHPRKNIVRLIKAFERYKKQSSSDQKLLIVGRPAWNFDRINQVYLQSTYVDDIVMLHDVKEEVKDLLAAADALVYISLFEGFGIPILEAFAAEVPVVTSDRSSMPEVAGDAAILVDPMNVDDITKALHIIKNESHQDRISRGRNRVSQFNWDITADIIYSKLKDAYLKGGSTG